MADMKMTDEEAKEYASCGPCEPGDGPKYPYGLRLCLDSATLKKLGIDAMPAVGSVMQLAAVARVVSASSNEQMDGDINSSIDLQITDMDMIKAAKTDAERAKTFYPDMA